jgi:hypothetical protein
MLKIDRVADDAGVRLVLSGRIAREGLAELERTLHGELGASRAVALDTAEVRLLDREAVQFLVRCAERGIAFVNTPAYVREWMNREQKGMADDARDSAKPQG